jgi:hypothetical protein
MVPGSDAVVYPWTVMVESVDTLVADPAVSAARGSDDSADGTDLLKVFSEDRPFKVLTRLPSHKAWVHGTQEEHQALDEQGERNDGPGEPVLNVWG